MPDVALRSSRNAESRGGAEGSLSADFPTKETTRDETAESLTGALALSARLQNIGFATIK
jgi:hypothetical protein